MAFGCVSNAVADDDLFTRYFVGVNGGGPCYARSYDDAHLKAHPKQQVRRIAIDLNERSQNLRRDLVEIAEARFPLPVLTGKGENITTSVCGRSRQR